MFDSSSFHQSVWHITTYHLLTLNAANPEVMLLTNLNSSRRYHLLTTKHIANFTPEMRSSETVDVKINAVVQIY